MNTDRLRPGWLFVIVALAVLLWSARSYAAPPECVANRDYASLQFGKPLELVLVLNADSERELKPLGTSEDQITRVSPSAPMVKLHFGLGNTWELRDEKRTPLCRLDFAKLWKQQPPPLASIRVSGPTVPLRVLTKILGAAGSLMFFVAPSDRQQRFGKCPSAGGRLWLAGEDFTLPTVPLAKEATAPPSLWVQTPDGRSCLQVATLNGDDRNIWIEVGHRPNTIRGVYKLAALADIQTPTTEDGYCAAELGGFKTPCDNFEQVSPEISIGHARRRVSLRVLPAIPRDLKCPAVPPPRSTMVSILGPTACACIYAETSDRKGVEVLTPKAATEEFGDFKLDVCRSTDVECVRASVDANGLWRADLGATKTPNLNLRVTTRASKRSAVFETVELSSKARPKDERVFAAAGVIPFDAECLPAFSAGEGDLANALTATQPNSATITEWEPKSIEGSGTKLLCPKQEVSDKGMVPKAPREQSRFIDTTTIEFRIGSEPYFTRTLVSEKGVEIASVIPYEGDDAGPTEPASKFQAVGLFTKTVSAGNWLCLDVPDSAVANLRNLVMDPERIAFRGTESAPLFVSAANFSQLIFSRTKMPNGSNNEQLFCTRFEAPNLTVSLLSQEVPEQLWVGDNTCRCSELEGCGESRCLHLIRRAPTFAGATFGVGVGWDVSHDFAGITRSGFKAEVPLFEIGTRLGPRVALLARAGLSFGASFPIAGDPLFDASEQRSGTCVAGCRDVQRVQNNIFLGPFAGPCASVTLVAPFLFLQPCVGVRYGAMWDFRGGSGVYKQNDGAIVKVGERGNAHFHLEGDVYGIVEAQVTMGER